MSFVSDKLELINGWAKKNRHQFLANRQNIEREVRAKLRAVNPVLAITTEVKLVANPRRNFINIRVSPNYQTMLYFERTDGHLYCFFLSDKFEPYIIITVLHEARGHRLPQIEREHMGPLFTAVSHFKRKYGIKGETYHYTGTGERRETEAFGVHSSAKAHSAHFHVKMRVSTEMLIHRMPIYGMLKLHNLVQNFEPIQYNFARKAVSIEELKATLNSELGDGGGPEGDGGGGGGSGEVKGKKGFGGRKRMHQHKNGKGSGGRRQGNADVGEVAGTPSSDSNTQPPSPSQESTDQPDDESAAKRRK